MSESDAAAEPAARATILVLEDDDAIRKAILRVLERAGYAMLGAASPAQALELASDAGLPLRLLITDFTFHAVTGRDVAEQLLRDRPDLRILFISGHGQSEVLPDAARPGTAFLQKPFSMEALVREVRGLLS